VHNVTVATTILRKWRGRPHWIIYGKSVIGGGVATGEIETGLYRVLEFSGTVSSAVASAVSANEAFPLPKGTITVFTSNNNETIYWEAKGDPR
jgi:hypothetical protein